MSLSSLSTRKGNLIEEREKKLFGFNKCGEADQGGFILGMKGGGETFACTLVWGKEGAYGQIKEKRVSGFV